MMQFHQLVVHHTDSFVLLLVKLAVIAMAGEVMVSLTLSRILEIVSPDRVASASQS